jgi:hypothetical protein
MRRKRAAEQAGEQHRAEHRRAGDEIEEQEHRLQDPDRQPQLRRVAECLERVGDDAKLQQLDRGVADHEQHEQRAQTAADPQLEARYSGRCDSRA